jgi:iron-sulfur cluster assembly protein
LFGAGGGRDQGCDRGLQAEAAGWTVVMIAVTEKASAHIQKLMAKQGLAEGGLRVGVKGGGCSGLSYTFSWEKEARTGDEVFEGPGGTKIFVDKKSLIYLNGTTLEYDTALMGKGLHFINPNAKASCGCGSSFQV